MDKTHLFLQNLQNFLDLEAQVGDSGTEGGGESAESSGEGQAFPLIYCKLFEGISHWTEFIDNSPSDNSYPSGIHADILADLEESEVNNILSKLKERVTSYNTAHEDTSNSLAWEFVENEYVETEAFDAWSFHIPKVRIMFMGFIMNI